MRRCILTATMIARWILFLVGIVGINRKVGLLDGTAHFTFHTAPEAPMVGPLEGLGIGYFGLDRLPRSDL